MPRLQSIEPEQATGKTAAIYGKVKSWMKRVPNLYKGLGNSPQALEGYLMLADLIGQGSLTPQEQQIVFMVANEFNECHYCVAAHSPGLKAVGFDDEAMLDIRRGKAEDPKHQALIDFVRRVLETKGFVSNAELAAVKAAGYSDRNIADLMPILAQKLMSNYFNHIHETELDFPEAPPLD